MIFKFRVFNKLFHQIKNISNCHRNQFNYFRTFYILDQNTRMEAHGDMKIRKNPIVMKLNTPEFDSIFTDELKSLIKLFENYNYEIRIAGGAVRDILMNNKPKDIDFATTATPDEMKEMFNKENIRMINTKGEKHGTITPRINDKENFEITTLRIDVTTDGRRAEVKFTTDWQLDANRRDLTINSMFLGFDGSVYDYFYGYEDLKKHRVVFVGSADSRIKEDYLRILRYFRFYNRIANNPNMHDETTIQAIVNNISGLEQISGERIWSEMKKILQGKFSLEMMEKMLDCNVAKYIGLPNSPNRDELRSVFNSNKKFQKEPLQSISYMTALLENVEDATELHSRLKLSAFERDLALFIVQNRTKLIDAQDIMSYKRLSLQPNARRDYVEEILKYHGKKDIYDEFKNWKCPNFQINGTTLERNGCPPGKTIGIALRKLKLIWAEENFTTSNETLLNEHLPKILNELQLEKNVHKKIKTCK